jgi:hypothetical protein
MAEESAFRGVLNFFAELGIYDVILPFLLVFAIVYAILDKTRVLGSEKVGSETYPRKSINAVVALSIGFFTVASAQLVQVITQVSSQVVILLLVLVLFMALIGTFIEQTDKGISLPKGIWQNGFMVVVLIAIVMILLNALDWLQPGYEFLRDHWSNELVASVILLLSVIGIIGFVTKSPGEKKTP